MVAYNQQSKASSSKKDTKESRLTVFMPIQNVLQVWIKGLPIILHGDMKIACIIL